MISKWQWTDAILLERKISGGTFKTAIALASFADSQTGQEARPGQAKLAEMLGVTDRAIRKNLDTLERAGWIVKVSRGGRSGNQNHASVYDLAIPTGTVIPGGTEVPIGTEVPTGTEIPTGTEVPGTEVPLGTEVPHPTGTFRFPTGTPGSYHPTPNTQPSTSSPRSSRKKPPNHDDEFIDWYTEYPKKEARAAARAAYAAARKKATAEQLLEGVKRYAASVKDKDRQFIKLPATWLRAECWDDEIPEVKEPQYLSFEEQEAITRARIAEEEDMPVTGGFGFIGARR